MATFMRYGFLRRLPGLRSISSLNPVSYPCARCKIHFQSQSKALVAARTFIRTAATQSPQTVEEELSAITVRLADKSVDQKLVEMDSQLRMRGRLTVEQVRDLQNIIKKEGSVTEKQALWLLRATGSSLIMEHPTVRHALFEEAWMTLENLGVKFTARHFNSAIRVQLENKHNFDPIKVLDQMQTTYHVAPDRITYALLIARYCEDGDVAAANKVLEYMKKEDMLVGDLVFHSFIKGYMVSNDYPSALETMEKMREAGLNPSTDTYIALLSGLALHGNLEEMTKILDECAAKRIAIGTKEYLDLVFILATNGHVDLAPKIIERISTFTPFSSLLQCILQLVAHSQDSTALRLFDAIQYTDPVRMLFYQTFIKHDRPQELLMSTMEKYSKNIEEDLSFLTIYALARSKKEYSFFLLDKMKEKGLPVRLQHFWPIMKSCLDSQDYNGVLKALGCILRIAPMSSLSVDLQQDVIYSFHNFGLLPFTQNGKSVADTLAQFQEIGLETKYQNSLEASFYLSKGRLQEAVEVLKRHPNVEFISSLLAGELRTACSEHSEQWQNLMQIVGHLNNTSVERVERYNMIVLSNLMRKLPLTHLENVTTQFIDKKWKIDNRGVVNLMRTASQRGLPSEFIKKVQSLDTEHGSQLEDADTAKQLMTLNFDELKALHAQRKSEGHALSGVELKLIRHYCGEKKLQEAEELMKSLEGSKMKFHPHLLRALALLNLSSKQGKLERTLQLIDKLHNDYPTYSPYIGVVLGATRALTTAQRVDEALDLMLRYSQQNESFMNSLNYPTSFALQDRVDELVSAATKPGEARRLLDMAFLRGYIKAGCFNLLRNIVQQYIDQEDWDGMLEVLEYYNKQYSRLPHIAEAMAALITKEQTKKLQSLVDLASAQFGENDVLHQLLFAFITTDKPRQADKILQTPRLHANNSLIDTHCSKLSVLGKISELESVVEKAWEIPGVDRDLLLFHLIRYQCQTKVKDLDKMMEVFERYASTSTKPSDRTLRYVAKVLKSTGRHVPFEIPQRSAPIKLAEISSTPTDKALSEAMIKLSHSTVLDIISKVKEPKDVSQKVWVALAEYFSSKNSQIFYAVLRNLGKVGQVESLLDIKESVSLTPSQSRAFHRDLALAHVNSGTLSTLLDLMKSNMKQAHEYFFYNLLEAIHRTSPEQWPSVDQFCRQHAAETGRQNVVALLSSFYYIHGQFDKARELMKEHSDLTRLLPVRLICSTAMDQRNVEVLERLLEDLGTETAHTARIYTAFINCHCLQGDWQSALDTVQAAKAANVDIESLSTGSRARLSELLKQNNQQPEGWTFVENAPQRKTARRTDEESSDSSDSSDSSSSDDEPGKPAK